LLRSDGTPDHRLKQTGAALLVLRAWWTMSASKREYRTSLWLWAAFSIAAFVLAGYLLRFPEAKDNYKSYWEHVWTFVAQRRAYNKTDLGLAIVGLFLALPSVGVGWVLQGVAQVMLGRKRQVHTISPIPSTEAR
jgi:hypothetical protein